MPTSTKDTNRLIDIGGEVPTNGANDEIEIYQTPYRAEVMIEGVCPLIFHRWNNEAIEEKANSKKGSKEKKMDNIPSYLWPNEEGILCLPGEYLKQSVINAAKYEQDPRSPRKSMVDLMKAALVSLTDLAPVMVGGVGAKAADYIDKRRAVVQRQGITRCRPTFHKGWKATIQLMVNLPDYVPLSKLRYLIQQAGLLVGVGDFRPSYGRFIIISFKELTS